MTSNPDIIQSIKEISPKLSTENKRYVIAVANALLFSQHKKLEQPTKTSENRSA